jgi:hypothetical protein
VSEAENSKIVKFQLELDHAKTYAEVWDIVKNTGEMTLDKHRGA